MWNKKVIMKNKAIDLVRRYIGQQQLLHPDARYLVALSGGADSVCLLLMLQELGYRIEAVHCNFHLRGEESNRDETFVKNLCQKHGIPLHITHFDTETYASLHKVSIEMAARQLRYHYFEQLRTDIGAEGICVAHHSDDSAETVLMNLLRGTGLRGLQGIRPRQGHILRPLLCIGRNEIETWLSDRHQPYVTDSTNLHDDILRNYLRLNVIPQLRQMVPAASQNILTTARRVGEAVRIYEAATAEALQLLKIEPTSAVAFEAIDVGRLLQSPSPESLLYEWLSPYGFGGALAEDIVQRLRQSSSGRLWSSDTHDVCLHRGQLLLASHQEALPTLRIPEPGLYRYTSHQTFSISYSASAVISREPHVATLDADTLQFPLTLRPIQPADRFLPYGMKGSKLVSDYLTDRHLCLLDKRSQLVVADATSRIVWLVSHRIAAPFAISSTTQHALVIKLSKQ